MDTNTPLTDREAGRIKTVLEQRGIRVVLRKLIGFSPKEVAKMDPKSHDLTAEAIAEMAGREKVNV
jgi:hypothetical protein